MKISVRWSEGESAVSVFLTEDEAVSVARALRGRVDGEAGHRGPGYHLHLEDGEGCELTIAVLDPD